MGVNNNSKKLGIVSAVALLVSGMIGSAIFSMSGLTISYAGPASIISWILAAMIQLFYGLSVVELATTYKKNGGAFVFPESTFGENKGKLLGFLSVWGCMMADIIAIAFSSMYVGKYLSAGFTGLDNLLNVLSIASILLCLILNIINFSTTGKINIIFTSILGILLIIYSVFVLSNENFSLQNMQPFFTQGSEGTFGFLKAIPIAMIAYSAITSISYMANEIDKPNENIPKAVYIGIAIAALIYILVIISTVGIIKADELNESGTIYIPLFQVCFTKLSSIKWLSKLIAIAAVFALITTILVVIAMTGRNIKAVADKKLLPSIFSIEGKSKTPIVAMIVVAFFGMILSQYQNLTETLINLGALFAIVTIVINLISLIFTRKNKKSKDNNEFKAPFNNIFVIMILIVIICCYIPDIINGGKMLWIFSIAWYIVGYIVYRIMNAKS